MLTLHPKNVALIGASDDPEKLGHMILKNLSESGYKGKIIPVNPKHEKILGLPCVKDIADIKELIDLAIIVTPMKTVLPLAEACARKKVKTLIVISAGFAETGSKEGKDAEEALRQISFSSGMTIVGPNCLGLLIPNIGLNASFAATPKLEGNIALISQSGAMAVALLDAADAVGIGFSVVFSLGNKAATTEADVLHVLEGDPHTKVIGLYVESIADGKRFVDAARNISPTKPIVLLKAGTSNRGARAVSSHTGALAGSTAALDAACSAAGIRRANDTAEFFRLLRVLSSCPELPEKKIAIITNAGGPGVLATDAAEQSGLTLPTLSKKSTDFLRNALPTAASVGNPIDVLGDAKADRYASALVAAAKDPEVEGLVCLLTPQVMTPCEEIAKAIVATKKSHPLMPIVTSFMGGAAVHAAKKILAYGKVPCFETPENAVRAMAALHRKNNEEDEPFRSRADDDDRSSAAYGILEKKRGVLPEANVADLLALYKLPTPEQSTAKNAKDAVEIAAAIGFPVILKVSSTDILHKTDVGGVRADLRDGTSVARAYEEIMENCSEHAPTAAIKGITVQKFLPAGSEFIVGGLRDPSFGPMVMVGLGGIYTELFRDTAFRLAPVSLQTALTMLTELKSWKLLLGMRGKAKLDIDKLAETIVQVSSMIGECEDIAEIDLNPVLVREKGVMIADAKLVLRK